MFASDTFSPAVLRLQSVALLNKNKAWMEVEKNAEKIAQDALAKKTKAAAFQPTFTDTSACNELIRGVALDYEKNANNFPGRPPKIARCRRGGLVFLPGYIPIGTNFMIIEPIFCKGKSTIGGVEVDMEHYYVILKECDVHVEDDGKLVALAMSDIQ
ncbi:hypothetical protein Pdw03_2995 [Penicillium digitatum]|uniref:Uncharacterized protein n=2 Tax=Penicillium digitatum TaxID=36651 RepID=K9FAM9_PEND1|nr:hypothetical protein PDIP_84840 [Penicillium digitatum Pd1]EKV05122.1 hypothetical protein PDIP_84840 [Penicillium digitatum Pd1]KAG0161576.1 hypothetical protein PDIDSM_9110 [Penicillium digitatum]QQK40141.1 hypothetical protein Pdw03_2995 [Penicillium digitatum]